MRHRPLRRPGLRHRRLRVLTAAALIALCAGALPAQAADPSGATPLEEVTVTARKREETLTAVPVAVSAFGAAQLERAGLANLEQLSRFAPGLSVANQGGTFGGRLLSAIRFRGMNPTVLTPSTQIGALFVDGVFFLGGAQSIGFEDVERVEVIRGPQAAYFGRSTFGGAIDVVTRDPGREFGGRITAEGGSFGSYGYSAAVEGPLGARAAWRLTASRREKGAQYTASDGGDLGRERTDAAHATLLLTPADGLRIKLRASHAQDDDGAPTAVMVGYSRFGNCPRGTPLSYRNAAGQVVAGALTLPFQCGALPFDGVRITGNTIFPAPFEPAFYPLAPGQPPQNLPLDVRGLLVDDAFRSPSLGAAPRRDEFGLVRRIERYAATFEWAFAPALTLSGALAYNRQRGMAIRDSDYSDVQSIYAGAPSDFEDRSGELRLAYDARGRLRLMAGFNVYEQDTNQGFSNGIEATFGFRIPSSGPLARPHPLQSPSAADVIETTGVFGSIEYDVLPTFTVTLEGRWQADTVGRFSGSEFLGLMREPDYESREFLPRAILAWHPHAHATLYAQYAKGTLPGDNTNLTVLRTLTPAQRAELQAVFGGDVAGQIESEILDSYELGLKQELLDGRLRYTLAGYSMDWKNQKAQALVVLTADNPRTASFRVPGDSEIRGVEFEAGWAATERLRLGATLNWTDSKYAHFDLAANAEVFGGTVLDGYDAAGNTQPRFPEWSGTLSATWADRLGETWSWYARGDLLYTGRQYVDELNLAWVAAYSTFDLAVGFERDALGLQLYADNLLDEEGWATAAGTFDLSVARVITLPLQRGAIATPIDSRVLGVRVTYGF